MNTLGVYFGPQTISIIEAKGTKPVNNAQISRSLISSGEVLEEKVPENLKLITLFKDELIKKGIEAKEVAVSLSGKDLIVRTFELPVMPVNELNNAINFEIKKYIPFKLEELVSDAQWKIDKVSQKTHVLFVGIKKDILVNYISTLSQLGLKINVLEYSAFSVLRLFKLNNTPEKGIIAAVTVELKEDDEINFMVLENEFPLFSRDIIFTSISEESAQAKGITPETTLEKLKREIRISLDYYRRKFPAKNIEKVFFISPQDYRQDLEIFIKEVELPAQFIDLSRYIGREIPPSLGFVKAYSISLAKVIRSTFKIDLLTPTKREITSLKEIALSPEKILSLAHLWINPRIIMASLLIFVAAFLFGRYQALPLQKELRQIKGFRPKVALVNPDASYDELASIKSGYREKIDILDNLVKKQIHLTYIFDIIPRVMPQGSWLDNLSLQRSKDEIALTLKGKVYLNDSVKEFKTVNTFVSSLKDDRTLNEYFKKIEIVSLDQQQEEKVAVTNFIISCLTSKKRER